MSDHGTQLGVDLNELYIVAHYLDKAANDFTQAANVVFGCQEPQADAPWITIVQEWLGFQTAVYNLLNDNAKNMTDTATALNNNADNYAAADQAAAAEFQKLQQDDQGPGW